MFWQMLGVVQNFNVKTNKKQCPIKDWSIRDKT